MPLPQPIPLSLNGRQALGASLLNRKASDTVTFATPAGERKSTIVEVR